MKRSYFPSVAGVLALLASLAFGQTRPAEPLPETILEVRVEGNKALSATAVLAEVRTRPGQAYSEPLVREDEQRLLKTRRYDNVEATRTQTDQGVIVTFRVSERPLVQKVAFAGNKAAETKDLAAMLTYAEGDPIDPYAIEAAARAIEASYRAKGYLFAQVQYAAEAARRGEVSYEIVEGPKVTLRKIVFQGAESFPASRLMRQIKTRTRWWPFRSGAVDAEQVDRDVLDLQTFYRDRGFLDVEVASALSFPTPGEALLTFVVHEQTRYRVRGIVVEGNRVFTTDALVPYLQLQAGQFHDGPKMQADLKKLRDLYGEIGYIQAAVEPRIRYAEAPGLVDVVYCVDEGGQFRVGRIEIRGNRITKMNVLRRQLGIFPTGLYNTVAAEESRARLSDSGLFKRVSITPYGDEPGVRHAAVEVEEGQTGMVMFGVGVSSNAGLLGNISFSERNFDLYALPGKERPWGTAFRGAGQQFSITAEPGTEFSRFRVDWREPALADGPYALGLRGYYFAAGRESYDENRAGGLVSLGRRFPNRWYGEIANRLENVRINDLDDDAPPDVVKVQGGSVIDGIQFSLVRDNTDSQFLPSKGDRLSLSYEQVVGDFSFGKPEVDYRRYVTLHTDPLERKHILALRAASGAIVGDAPVFERFYGGGLGSVRGFAYRGISPRQGPDEDPVGGDFMIFAGGEYSYPIYGEMLRGVFFLDSGTVESDIGLTDYRVSVGFGFRLHLKVFGPVPMSFDFGLPVLKNNQDDTQVFSFSVGWVF